MHRDLRLFLDDILEAITKIRDYTSELDYATFTKDAKTQDAVVRNLEIISSMLPASTLPQSKDGPSAWVVPVNNQQAEAIIRLKTDAVLNKKIFIAALLVFG